MAKVGIISLGCSRNLVDSEAILTLLNEGGHEIVEIEDAEVAIANTCSFIEGAKAESIDTIMELAQLKKEGKLKKIVVAGCLAQRYKKELAKELVEVDGFIGAGNLEDIKEVINKTLGGKKAYQVPDSQESQYNYKTPKIFLTPPHYRYLKIQEGCGNRCSFCVIPQIKGPLRSRPMESVLKEISSLSPEVKEINIIGQDTTLYGRDLYKEVKLSLLIERIAKLNKINWIRLLYTHPAHISERLIKVIRDYSSVCKYIDLPLQHISDRILRAMNRSTKKKDIISLIDKLRKEIPELAIRTTLVVGFPGEKEEHFEELVEFIKKTKFERLGVFTYSREKDTPAFSLPNQVPESVKLERYNHLMKIQQDISLDVNKSFLGKKLNILIDEKVDNKPGWFLGRTQYDAPEVDGQVWIKANKLKTGQFAQVRITDTLEYDLVGSLI